MTPIFFVGATSGVVFATLMGLNNHPQLERGTWSF